MRASSSRHNIILNRFKRVPFIVFLKRFTPFLIFILILLISFLVGLWNVRSFDFQSSNLVNITQVELESYLSIYKGRNIFLLRPYDVRKTLIESDGYIKEVEIKKLIPSKLEITVQEYTPLYVGYSSDNCLLFAQTGEFIEEICTNCEKDCPAYAVDKELVFISSGSLLESGGKLIYFEEIYKVERILAEFKYKVITLDITEGIATFNDIENHSFVFDLSTELDTQLARMYLVGQKVDQDMIKFSSLDLRFERPVMRF